MSDTPITDNAEVRFSSLCNPADSMWVPSKVAKTLERANAALRKDKARYEFCKHHMTVGTHGLAPGVTDITMARIPIDCVLLSADEIIDRAMLPGTAANVQYVIDAHNRGKTT